MSSGTPLESLVVIEFTLGTHPSTIQWILKKITAAKDKGGIELKACLISDRNLKDRIIHIGADITRLLLTAELLEIKKMYQDGSMREIDISVLDQFMYADQQRIIWHELMSIRAVAGDDFSSHIAQKRTYHGESIIAYCIREGVIDDLYPLHRKDDLRLLCNNWYRRMFAFQPLDEIEDYFGETITMYFAFIGFYTMSLIAPACVSLLSLFTTSSLVVPLTCLFNTIWTVIFLESWKRSSVALAYNLGTLDLNQFEEPRLEFYGAIKIDKVTGRLGPHYSSFRRLLKYLVTIPIILICLTLAVLAMVFQIWLRGYVVEYHRAVIGSYPDFALTIIDLSPTIIYAILMQSMNQIYPRLARFLNDWENHRLQSEYEYHLLAKLVSFIFLNSFIALFYTAFYVQDMALLRKTLGTLLITTQITGNISEAIVPYVLYRFRKMMSGRQPRLADNNPARGCSVSEESRQQAELQSVKEQYAGTMGDYLEMFMQFGYVYLFAAVFPSAAFWALLNNIYEIHTDAFKLCKICKRPFSIPAADIGVWQIAFELLATLGVITNCALVYLNPDVKQYMSAYSPITTILIFVIIEHMILLFKATIAFILPEKPEYVATSIAAVEYENKQAWRHERAMESKKSVAALPGKSLANLPKTAKTD